MPVVELRGTPRERGHAYGETLRSQVQRSALAWRDYIARVTAQRPDDFITEFLHATDFEPAARRWTPECLEELSGLSEASGVSYELLLSYNYEDEVWWYLRNRRYRIPLEASARCSSVGVAGRPTVLGQNMDVGTWVEGLQTVLRIEVDSPQGVAMLFTVAGKLGLNGLNASGVGICCNTLIQLDPCPQGLPVTFVLRGALAAGSFGDAVAFIRAVRHASGQNYMVGSPGAVMSLECSSHGVAEFRPEGAADLNWHTNHPLQSKDCSVYGRVLANLERNEVEPHHFGTEQRLSSLETRMRRAKRPIGVPDIIQMLSASDDTRFPVCRHFDPTVGAYTAGCSVYELEEGLSRLHVAAGPPDETRFITLDCVR